MTESEEFVCACRVLHHLKVTENYAGFYQTAYAVSLCIQNPELLQALGKWLYPEVAARYNTGISCVEKNIRKIRNFCWHNSRDLIIEMAGNPLAKMPGNARFLALLTSYVRSITKPSG